MICSGVTDTSTGFVEALHGDVVGVRVALLLAAHRAYAHTLVEVSAAALHDAFFESHGVLHRVLEVQVGVVDLALEGRLERALEMARLEAEAISKEDEGVMRALARAFSTHRDVLLVSDGPKRLRCRGCGVESIVQR